VKIEIVEASDRLPGEPYLSLLLLAAFPRTAQEGRRIGETFRDRTDHFFWVATADDQPIGACGVVESDGDVATIRYLAVAPDRRWCGVGRRLVDVAIERTSRRIVEAETDGDATGFYRTCGFTVRSIGEKYPGVVRYVCRYEKPLVERRTTDASAVHTARLHSVQGPREEPR
jgi:GNAT superfamily N-acetyltransferase